MLINYQPKEYINKKINFDNRHDNIYLCVFILRIVIYVFMPIIKHTQKFTGEIAWGLLM